MTRLPSSPADEVHNLDRVALGDQDVLKGLPFDNRQIVLDGDTAWVDVEAGQQPRKSHGLVKLEPFAVEGNDHV